MKRIMPVLVLVFLLSSCAQLDTIYSDGAEPGVEFCKSEGESFTLSGSVQQQTFSHDLLVLWVGVPMLADYNRVTLYDSISNLQVGFAEGSFIYYEGVKILEITRLDPSAGVACFKLPVPPGYEYPERDEARVGTKFFVPTRFSYQTHKTNLKFPQPIG